MKVALVYDRVNKWGGAERVLLVLHEMFPDAPLYTSVYNEKTAPWASVFPKVTSSFLQNFPFSTRHELYAPLMPLAFESFNFSAKGGPASGWDDYDLVISVTSEAAKGIITKPQTRHICYCLTPTRYLWSGYEDYFQNPWLRNLSKPVISYLRAWDKIAAQRPDHYIAISKEVKGRIKKYYLRESEVVYPPVTLGERGKGKGENKPYTLNPSPYFLVVSRLVPYKRIDLAIDAFNELGWPLKIVGTGIEEGRLKRKARGNIEFLGNLTDRQLSRYYEDCIALIVPGIEDFGLGILEAQSFGRPVIAFRGGGALETISPGRTGEFFYPQTKEALIKRLKDFNDKDYKRSLKNQRFYRREDCIENAEKFSKEKFKEEFQEIIARLLH